MGVEPWLFERPAHSLVIIPTERVWLLFSTEAFFNISVYLNYFKKGFENMVIKCNQIVFCETYMIAVIL